MPGFFLPYIISYPNSYLGIGSLRYSNIHMFNHAILLMIKGIMGEI